MIVANQTMIDETVDGLLVDADDDSLGLWQIVSRVAGQSKSLSEEGIRDQAFKVIRSLLKHGLVAGDLKSDGSFERWLVDDADVINKIEMRWNELGRAPEIGD